MFKWKHYCKLLDDHSVNTFPRSMPVDENGNEIEHFVEDLQQIAHDLDFCDQMKHHMNRHRCFKYNNLRFYAYYDYKVYYLHDRFQMSIALLIDRDLLFVFDNGKWMYEGKWPLMLTRIHKQIKDILFLVDRKIKAKENIEEVFKKIDKRIKFLELTDKWESKNG